MNIRGPFDVRPRFDPPHADHHGVSVARAVFDKTFHGALEATSQVDFLSAMRKDVGSGAYVAIERVEGTLAGRRGGFVLSHVGTLTRGAQALEVRVVPDSGSGELVGLRGTMRIEIDAQGGHFYELEFELEGD